MSVKSAKGWVSVLLGTAVLLLLTLNEGALAFILRLLFPGESEHIYPRIPLSVMLSEHLVLIGISSGLAVSVGLLLGIFVTRPAGRDFMEIVSDVSSLSQTIPPVAVLALAVPFLGFGARPTIVALFLYSILPVIRNTISGINTVPRPVKAAARGMGMRPWQILYKVELPLAIGVIMAGIRISVVINVGTATIGAVVGAGGLGTPIISGLVRDNPSFVMQGAIASGLLALIADGFLGRLEALLSSPDPGSTAS